MRFNQPQAPLLNHSRQFVCFLKDLDSVTIRLLTWLRIGNKHKTITRVVWKNRQLRAYQLKWPLDSNTQGALSRQLGSAQAQVFTLQRRQWCFVVKGPVRMEDKPGEDRKRSLPTFFGWVGLTVWNQAVQGPAGKSGESKPTPASSRANGGWSVRQHEPQGGGYQSDGGSGFWAKNPVFSEPPAVQSQKLFHSNLGLLAFLPPPAPYFSENQTFMFFIQLSQAAYICQTPKELKIRAPSLPHKGRWLCSRRWAMSSALTLLGPRCDEVPHCA